MRDNKHQDSVGLSGAPVGYRLRVATPEDEAALRNLIADSIRALGLKYYTPDQIEAALRGAFGVDSTIIRDGTYFVAVTDAGILTACGGWRRGGALFGSEG